jgi:hypothetical protein
MILNLRLNVALNEGDMLFGDLPERHDRGRIHIMVDISLEA